MKIKVLNESYKNGLVGPILINKTAVNFDPKRVMFFNAETGSHIKTEKIAEMAKPNSHLIPYITGLLMYGKSKGLLKEEQIILVREKLGRTDEVTNLSEKVYHKLSNDVAKKASKIHKKTVKREQPAWKPAIESIEVGDVVKVDSNHGGGTGTIVDLTENGRFAVVRYSTGRMEPFHESLLTLKRKKRNLKENVELGQVVKIDSNADGGTGEVVEIEGDYAYVEVNHGEVGKFHIKDLTPKARLMGKKIYEAAPPGMEDWIKDNKAEFKERHGKDWESKLYATAWSIYNKKNESVQEQRIDRRQPPPGMEQWIEDKKMEYIKKYGRQWMPQAIEDAWELYTSGQKAAFL